MRNIQPALTVHVAPFAALLRDRGVMIAVHERALFDYLTLELSPAFPGDRLIAVEITTTRGAYLWDGEPSRGRARRARSRSLTRDDPRHGPRAGTRHELPN